MPHIVGSSEYSDSYVVNPLTKRLILRYGKRHKQLIANGVMNTLEKEDELNGKIAMKERLINISKQIVLQNKKAFRNLSKEETDKHLKKLLLEKLDKSSYDNNDEDSLLSIEDDTCISEISEESYDSDDYD